MKTNTEGVTSVLKDLKEYVIVVGSYARGDNHIESDIDLYVKRRPQEELDSDWFGEIEEHYIDKVIEVFEKHNLKWGSLIIGYVHTNDLPVQIEASSLFNIPKSTPIIKKNIFGIEIDTAVDEKDLSPEDKFY